MTFYISIRTQYGNLGDMLINRLLIEDARAAGNVKILAAGVPPNFVEAVAQDGEVTTAPRFLSGLIWECIRSRTSRGRRPAPVILYKPGGAELPAGAISGAKLFGQLVTTALIRVAGGTQRRCGFSAYGGSSFVRRLYRWRHQLLDTCGPRDRVTAHLLGIEEEHISSDYAWLNWSSAPRVKPSASPHHPSIGFSIRHRDRRIALCKLLVNSARLSATAISQVAIDDTADARSAGLPTIDWDGAWSGRKRLLEAYSQMDYVITDRLHVFLLALGCGSCPIAFVAEGDTKLISYLETLGLHQCIVPPSSQMDDVDLLNACRAVRATIQADHSVINAAFEHAQNLRIART